MCNVNFTEDFPPPSPTTAQPCKHTRTHSLSTTAKLCTGSPTIDDIQYMLVFIVSFLARGFLSSQDASSFYMTGGQLTDRGKSARKIQSQISAYAYTFMASVLNFVLTVFWKIQAVKEITLPLITCVDRSVQPQG